ncbi:MAG: carboxypeptidase regulatory-like domain-containing protein, partial [Anaerolineae bacterium]
MKTVSKGMNVVLVLALLLSTFVFSAAATPSPVSGQAGAAQTQEPSSKIEGALLDALAESGSADFFVVMAEKADLSAASKITDWSARGHYVYDALREVAARTQAPVIKYAEERGLAYRSFLTVNSVYFKGGTLQIAEDLAALPGVDTLRLEGEAYIQPDDEIEASLDAYGWNLSTLDPGGALYGMQAAQVWDTYGVRGENIIVANIDTGAYYQHEALVGQYRGNLGGGTFDHDFNWYMPTYGCGDGTYPCDNDGHGSGTIGIMAGQTPDLVEQIGVAPAASWIACKGCEEYSCSDAALTGCADWMVAPCPIGVDPGSPQCDPDRRPHIVNNSWGGGGCSTWYQGYVQAWVAAGIFPAFSAGNATACNALGSPGDNPEAFGTAAHSSVGTNLYAGGPSCFFPTPSCDPDAHEVDPHLNAPTFGRTADNSSNSYYNLSGTSGASPHTAGAVALMWSASPMFVGNIDDTFTFLEQSANKNVPAGNCGKPACAGANVYPNYEYGWGYLDALAAVEMILANTGDSIITGEVTDVDTSAPLADAMVEAASPTQTYAALTNPDGIYTLNVFSGTYTVTVSAFGYLPAEITDVVATTGMTTTLDVALEMAEWYEVTGTVTDSATGWPLYAKIDIDGYPGPDIWTDPVTGEYGITLPEGIEFTFDVTAWVAGYNGAAVAVGPLTGNEVVDIALDANLEACDAPGYDMLYAYLEDFEVDNGSYVVSGTPADHWQWGVPVTWPSSCASGEHCWGTNLTGNYANNAITVLTSPVIDLSSESAPLTASWWQASYLESATWDQAYAEVSINGGGWQVMWEHTGATAQIDWSEKTYDLSAAAGGNVQFRFRLTSDFTVSYAGYYIDLVTITGASGCQIPVDGGLVVGNVYDYETDDPLVGARVENEAGEAMLTQATPHDPAVDDGFYTLFAPSGDQVFTATMALYGPDIETVTVLDGDTVRQDFYLPVGNLTADPTELHATVDLGSTETLWLTLENTGTGPASWEIVERDMGWDPAFVYIPPFTGQLPPSSEPLSFERAPRADSADTAELAEAIGLLTGAPAFAVNLASKDLVFFADADVPSAWTVVKPAFGSGSYYAGDFAGADFGQLYVIDNDAKQLVSVDTATGNTTIIGPCNPLAGQIWTGMSWDPTTDTMYGSATDGSVATLFTINLATGATTQVGTITGAPLTIDIAVNGDGEMYGVEIAIDSLIWINKATGGATAVGALGFDANYAQGMDFEEESGVLYWAAYGSANGQMRIIDTTTGASAPVGAFPGSAEVDCLAFATGGRTDVPWLTQDPITGTLAMGESQAIEVVFDAGVPEITQPGNYYAQLRVDNDTPYGPLVVPVTMTVSPPSSYGKLDGTVTGLGYCDVNPAPLEGAEVYVQSDLGMSWMVETDADGYYQLWLDEAHSPFTVTVTYPVHETGMATGVDIVGEETTTENFDLRWLQPCVTADPDEFAVTVVLGEQLTETLELLNTGAASTDFEIREKDQGFTPTAGEDVLVVAYDTTAATAMEAALAANGLTYLRVTRDVFQATPVEDLLEYQAVFYAGGYSGDSWAKAMAYLDAGGSFLIADNDLGYGNGSTTFYQQYLQSTYATDAGSDGVLTGVDIMAGINPDISADPYPDDFDVGAEGVEIFIAPTSKSAGVRVERNDYRAVYLAWDYQYTGSTADAEAIVAAAMQFLAAPDVPWLSLDPITGTLAADTGLVFVDVFFDAAEVAEPGIYMAEVQVRSDDPTSPLIVPVAMNVILLDSGRVEGIVTGLGYCDDDPAPLENAEVLIESSLGDTWTRITNEDGWYSQWVDPTHAPLTITVTAAGHETGVAVDV